MAKTGTLHSLNSPVVKHYIEVLVTTLQQFNLKYSSDQIYKDENVCIKWIEESAFSFSRTWRKREHCSLFKKSCKKPRYLDNMSIGTEVLVSPNGHKAILWMVGTLWKLQTRLKGATYI